MIVIAIMVHLESTEDCPCPRDQQCFRVYTVSRRMPWLCGPPCWTTMSSSLSLLKACLILLHQRGCGLDYRTVFRKSWRLRPQSHFRIIYQSFSNSFLCIDNYCFISISNLFTFHLDQYCYYSGLPTNRIEFLRAQSGFPFISLSIYA